MTIKEAAEITGLSIDNLRYYERIGLIPPIPRSKSGIREYDGHAIHWIEFVLKFKRAGMPLESIIEYIKLAHSDKSTQEARRQILIEAKEALENRIQELQECLDIANYKIENYYNLCDPITTDMIKEWEESSANK